MSGLGRAALIAGALAFLWAGAVARAEESPADLPAVIDAVRISTVPGLWVTRQAIILRELPWQAGETVTKQGWDLGLARLWNTGLFSQIDARIVHEGKRRIAEFKLEERVTLNPLFKFEFVTNGGFLPGAGQPVVWWGHIGASDPNLFGEFLEAGLTYEMFGNNPGGRIWFHNPRLFGKRLDGWFEINYLPRPRPGFVVFQGTARAQVFYEINDELVVLARVDGIFDHFIPPVTGETDLPKQSAGALVSESVKFGRVDTIRLLQKGWSLEVQPLFGMTSDPVSPGFVQGWAQFLGFIPLANRWNFALRVQAAGSSTAPPQDRFYLGGLETVRGLNDNAITTNAYAAFNVEVRVVAWDSTWLALMPTVFVDGALAEAQSGAGSPQTALSFGAGCRFLVPRFVGTGLRVDAAWALGPIPFGTGTTPSVSVGVYQFF